MPRFNIFPYASPNRSTSAADLLPWLPATLARENQTAEVSGLVDSGASVSVLPFQIGVALGAVWGDQMPLFRLSGNLANHEARGLMLTALIGDFEPVKLAFAWSRADDIPVIFGQTNFFSLFDICFRQRDFEFEIRMR